MVGDIGLEVKLSVLHPPELKTAIVRATATSDTSIVAHDVVRQFIQCGIIFFHGPPTIVGVSSGARRRSDKC